MRGEAVDEEMRCEPCYHCYPVMRAMVVPMDDDDRRVCELLQYHKGGISFTGN